MRAVGHAQLKHHTGYEEERASYLLRARCARALRRSITVALVSVGLLFGMRFLILVLEAYTMISGERGADDDLVKLCRDGAARSSVHMRRACMGAEVDRASPVIVRAFTRGAYNLGSEVASMAAYPLQSTAMTSVLVMSVLPWVGTLRALFLGSGGRHGGTSEPEHTVVILHNGDRPDALGPRARTVGTPRLMEACIDEEETGREDWDDVDLQWDRKHK